MENGSSLPCSQGPATGPGPYPKTHGFGTHPHSLVPSGKS